MALFSPPHNPIRRRFPHNRVDPTSLLIRETGEKERNGSGVPKLNKLSIKLMPGTRFCSDSELRNRFLLPYTFLNIGRFIQDIQ